MKSNRITRMMQIITTMQAGKSYAVSDLSKMFGTSRRTIFRDLKDLQEIGIPYRYDQELGGYIIESDFFLPPIDLNLQEALSLLVLAHKASKHLQVPFKKSSIMAAMKIENNLPSKIRKYCNKAIRNISARGGQQAWSVVLDRTFAYLQDSIIKQRKVLMQYDSVYDGKLIDVELCPYHLYYNHRAWYVIGHSDIHNSVRTFKLNRIRQLEISDKCFIDSRRFDLDEYLGRAWSMIPEGKLYNIRLKFSAMVAQNVAEVKWHETQKVIFQEDGSAIVEFRVDGLGEIMWWILGYGDQVKVLAPAQLREKILKVAGNMAHLNRGD